MIGNDVDNVQVVPVELEDILGVEDVAQLLDISTENATYAMRLGIIPSIVKRGRITLRSVLDQNKHKLGKLN